MTADDGRLYPSYISQGWDGPVYGRPQNMVDGTVRNTVCVQAAALFGGVVVERGQTCQENLQKLVNQEARHTTGAFRTTNQGALSMESGLRPAVIQLGNRLHRFALHSNGLGPAGIRRRARSDCEGSPGSSNQGPRAQNSHHHGRAGGHLEDDIRRLRSRPEIRDHDQKAHRRLPFLPTEDRPLPNRTISHDQSPGRELLVSIQHSRYDNTCSRTALSGDASRITSGSRLRRARKLPADPGTRSHQNRRAARRRAAQPSGLSFLATTDVGRTSGPPVAEEGDGAASEASEWENMEL